MEARVEACVTVVGAVGLTAGAVRRAADVAFSLLAGAVRDWGRGRTRVNRRRKGADEGQTTDEGTAVGDERRGRNRRRGRCPGMRRRRHPGDVSRDLDSDSDARPVSASASRVDGNDRDGERTAAATADLTSAAVARPDLVVVVTATFAVAAASADAGLRVGRGIRVRKVAAPSFPSRRLMATACAPCGRRSWAAARDVRGVRSTRARRCAPSDVNPDEGNVGGSETPDEDFQTHETTRSGCRS